MRILLIISFVSIINANTYFDFSNDVYKEVINSRNFTGKVVLITGSSSGIGEGTAKLFSILGAKVVVTGRNETRVKSVAEEVQKLSPHNLKPLQVVADLTKSDDVKRLVNSTIEEFGQLDVLVNNAGTGSFNSIRDAKVLEDFDFAFNVNVRAIVELIHRSIPYLEKSKGTIINISSLASLHPYRGMLSHHLAKAAVDMLTKVVALELAPIIRVNAINPGYIHTSDTMQEELIKSFTVNMTPLKKSGEPLDIAKGITFLASSDAQFITGTNLVIDGGLGYNITDILQLIQSNTL